MIQDKNALYYPYIHFRDIQWLKATLLCFPQVSRMVPTDLQWEHDEIVHAFQNLQNEKGDPLINAIYLDSYSQNSPAYKVQERLLNKLRDNIDFLKSKYSKDITIKTIPNDDVWRLHFEKMNSELWNFLIENNLGWNEDDKNLARPEYDTWVYMHPLIGETIMSIIAIELANQNGLDIVSDSEHIHCGLSSRDENLIISKLFNDASLKRETPIPTKVNDLTSVVLATQFDMTKLSPAQIAELIKEGKDLRKFKEAIVPIASRIADIEDPDKRKREFEYKAKEVIEEWKKYEKKLPSFALDALNKTAQIKVPAWLTAIVTGTTAINPIIGGGIMMVFLGYNGWKILKDYDKESDHPMKFLSKVEGYGASIVN